MAYSKYATPQANTSQVFLSKGMTSTGLWPRKTSMVVPPLSGSPWVSPILKVIFQVVCQQSYCKLIWKSKIKEGKQAMQIAAVRKTKKKLRFCSISSTAGLVECPSSRCMTGIDMKIWGQWHDSSKPKHIYPQPTLPFWGKRFWGAVFVPALPPVILPGLPCLQTSYSGATIYQYSLALSFRYEQTAWLAGP